MRFRNAFFMGVPCQRAAIAFAALTAAASVTPARAQQIFPDWKPYAIGKVAGQSLWLVKNCGGQITPEGDRTFKRAIAKDEGEFARGVREGHADQDAYATISGKASICTLLGGSFQSLQQHSRIWKP